LASFEALDSLETKVFNSEDVELPNLERSVVRLIQIEPQSAHAHYLLSHIMLRMYMNEPSELQLLRLASDLSQQAIELSPRQDFGYVALANILDAMGQSAKGLQLIEQSSALGVRSSWRMHLARARLATESENPLVILTHLKSALNEGQGDPEIIIPYVVATLQSKYQGDDLVFYLEHWNRTHSHPLFTQSMAMAHADSENYRKAHEIYAQFLRRFPNNIEATLNDAVILYKHLGGGSQAISLLSALLKSHASGMKSNIRATVEAHLGSAYLVNGNSADARKAFNSAVATSEGSSFMIDFIARTYRERKTPKEFTSLLEQLNETSPGQSIVYALLGETLSEELNEHEKAVKAYADAIILEPERSEYYNGMGLAYYRQNRFSEALKLFTTAIKVNPNDGTARYNEACVLARTGRDDEALVALKNAVSIDPRLQTSAKGDSDFLSLKGDPRFLQILDTPIEEAQEPTSTIGH